MLTFKKVAKSFGNTFALSDISFEVKDGEFVFITGPSGAGKTTLLRLITGELSPDKGTIIFGNKDISLLSAKEVPFHRQKIGVVFQDYKILLERTVRENVEVALAVTGIPESEWAKKVANALKSVGLEKKGNLFPAQLSGGEQQRAALARALVVNPKIILADEPTGNLDWETADGIMKLLEKINKEGKTVVVATHNRAIIEKMGKREIELKDGKIAKK